MATFSSTKAYSPWKPDSNYGSDDKENDFIANVLVADVPVLGVQDVHSSAASSLEVVQDVHSSKPDTGMIALLLEAGNKEESKPKEKTGMIALLLEASNSDEVVLIPGKRTRGKHKSFADHLEDLKRFKIQHGHIKVTNMDDKPLASWCSVLRFARKNPEKGSIKLTEYQISELDSIGFNWTSKEYVTKTFDQRIEALEEYKRINGHVNVRAVENNSLGQFCSNVRYARKKIKSDSKVKGTRKLTEDRIARLDALGFEW